MNNSKVEELLIPKGKGNAILCTGKVGISCSQDITNLLRKTFQTDENVVIIQLNDATSLQDFQIIKDSQVFKDITNCILNAQEQVLVYKKEPSIEGSPVEGITPVTHAQAMMAYNQPAQTGVALAGPFQTGVALEVLQTRPSPLQHRISRPYISRSWSRLKSEFQNFGSVSASAQGARLILMQAGADRVQGSDLIIQQSDLNDVDQQNLLFNVTKPSELLETEIIPEPLETEISLEDGLQREAVLNLLIREMPETSYLRRSFDLSPKKIDVPSDIVKNFKQSFRNVPIEKLLLLLDKQKRIKKFISKIRNDPSVKSERLKQLIQDKNFLVDTEILKVQVNSKSLSKSLRDLEIFLETLASKSYFLPFIIGCPLPYKDLNFIQLWYSENDLLPLLLEIQQSLQTTQSFKSSDLIGKLTPIAYANVCLNLDTLITGASVYADLLSDLKSKNKKAPKNKGKDQTKDPQVKGKEQVFFQKDHILVQAFYKAMYQLTLLDEILPGALQISDLGFGRG